MNEVLLFCKNNNIGIKKFLSTNYEVEYNESKSKIKHDDIASLPNIVKVPIRFSEKYEELVYNGELIIVRDDFGRYESYINPNLIKDLIYEPKMRSNLEELQDRNDYDSALIKQYLEETLAKLERIKRMMEFFSHTVNNKKGR